MNNLKHLVSCSAIEMSRGRNKFCGVHQGFLKNNSVRCLYPRNKYCQVQNLQKNCQVSSSNINVKTKQSYTDRLVEAVMNIKENTLIGTSFVAKQWKQKLKNGPGLNKFFEPNVNSNVNTRSDQIPYLPSLDGKQQKVFLDIYGCQMNTNDAEVVSSILQKSNYQIVKDLHDAEIILMVTCSIRDNAEQKIWNKLKVYRQLKHRRDGKVQVSKIGILGCMAERLKTKIFEMEKIVDVIAGPDSYRDLPRLLTASDNHETAINVVLSFDETYADIIPLRINPELKTAYVSIMRGCDNMCTYCIVPFTRGRERSRPIINIIDEVKYLSDSGIKEVTLLGQNVNSYRDISESTYLLNTENTSTNLSKGFKTVYKNKLGGLRFTDLLDRISQVNPEMRVRFTSPHPKDFPNEVLQLISERPNICKQLHVPAQSGNSSVLARMRRGYTRESYIELIQQIREVIPQVSLSSDFICGFCGETEAEFEETLTLMKLIKYNMVYMYAYSMREKTTAYRRLQDDVPASTKQSRLTQMIKIYRTEAEKLNKNQIGQQQLILVEGTSKRSEKDFQGRNDGNTKVIFPQESIPINNMSGEHKVIEPGDYIVVHVCDANSQILKGIPLYHTTVAEFHLPKNKLHSVTY